MFRYLKSKMRRFLPEEFIETESGFITSGRFSATIIEPHCSNSEMDSSTKSGFREVFAPVSSFAKTKARVPRSDVGTTGQLRTSKVASRVKLFDGNLRLKFR